MAALKSQLNEAGMEEGIKAVSLFQVGTLMKGKADRVAERSLRESLEISSRLLGDDHPYNAFAIFTLAGLFADQNRLDEAESYYRRCVTICREKAGMGYPRVALVVSEFATFLDRRGKRAEAIALYDEMIEGRRARFAADHVMLAEGLAFQGGFLQHRNPPKAEKVLLEADAIYRKHPEFRSVRLMECHEMLGEFRFNRWEFKEAEAHFRSALDLATTLPSTDFLDQAGSRAWNLGRLGASIMHQGRYAEAELALLDSIRIYRSKPGPPNQTALYDPLDSLAFLRRAQNRYLEAAGLTAERRAACDGNANLIFKVSSDLALCVPFVDPSKHYDNLAIEVLRQAIRAGFRDVRKLRTDPAMQAIRNRSDFREIADDLAFPTDPFQRSR
jgi:tetratricopeptide (TPR) repeat protein